MNDDQLLNSLEGGSTQHTTTTSPVQDQLHDMLEGIQPQLQLFLALSIVMSVIVFIGLLINSIYKIRVERAILRIDKNIQKLVDLQTPTEPAPATAAGSTDTEALPEETDREEPISSSEREA